jgi:hypothetical protein
MIYSDKESDTRRELLSFVQGRRYNLHNMVILCSGFISFNENSALAFVNNRVCTFQVISLLMLLLLNAIISFPQAVHPTAKTAVCVCGE